MMLIDLKRVIDQTSKERGIDKKLLIRETEKAVLSEVRKQLGNTTNIEAQYDDEYGDIQIIQYRMVVENVADAEKEVSYEYAKEREPDIEMGNDLGEFRDDITIENIDRIIARTARRIAAQPIKQINLKRIIDQISRERGIDKNLLVEAIQEAVLSAVKKGVKGGDRMDIEARYNEKSGDVTLTQYRIAVEEVRDKYKEVSYEFARLQKPNINIGDHFGEERNDICITDLGRIAAQSAKQIIIQKMKSAEQKVVYDMFSDRIGEVVSGIVQRFDRGNMIVNLGRTDALLPRDEQISKRTFQQGDRIRAYLKGVRQGGSDSQLLLSRTCNEFLEKLFYLEVPEIQEGIVRVMGVSRDPGFRAKIAVSSSEGDVDPVGACVGMKGSRVQNVVQELQGERIDIVTWSPDPAKYAYNALAPAHVSMVRVDEDSKSLLVVVPNDQLTLAIGRQGQNVRLASRLMGWKIDVKSEQRYKNLQDSGYQSLLALPGIEEGLADQLFSKGIISVAVLAAKSVEELTIFRAVSEDYATLLLTEAAHKAESFVEEQQRDEAENKESSNEDSAIQDDSVDTL